MRSPVYEELIRQADEPPGGDKRIAAFSLAMLAMDDLRTPPAIHASLLEPRRTHVASQTVNLALRVLQKQFIRHEPTYPESFDSVGNWRRAIVRLADDDQRVNELSNDLLRPVQSNVVERYKGIKLTAGILSPRIGSAPRLLDVGCSRNHGLKKLRLNLPFQPVTQRHAEAVDWQRPLIDSLVSNALQHGPAIGPSVGTDLVPCAGGDEAFWARSCSFYPTELLNAAAVNEYDYLDTHEFQGVEFVRGDFTGKGLDAKPPTSEFDAVTASTVFGQFTPEQRQHARGLFRDVLADHGVIIYQDFAQPGQRSDIDFADNWFNEPFPYRTMVEFAEDDRVMELFRWDSGRCRQWMPGKDMAEALAKA